MNMTAWMGIDNAGASVSLLRQSGLNGSQAKQGRKNKKVKNVERTPRHPPRPSVWLYVANEEGGGLLSL